MTDSRLLTRAGELRTGRTPFVMATVVRAERPTSARPGDQALVLPDGTVEGFVGGACAESTTRLEGLRLLSSGEPGLLRITPGGGAEDAPPPGDRDGVRTVDNPCLSGGTLEIFLEPVLPPALVLVAGDGPIARALVRVGKALDHEVRLVSDPAAAPPADTAAVVVAAHGRGEPAVLAAALRARVPYVALVASRKRAAGVLAEVAALDVPEEDLARVKAPAGLDIGARNPGEIALSVYAEMVARRRGRSTEVPAAEPSGGASSGQVPSGCGSGGRGPDADRPLRVEPLDPAGTAEPGPDRARPSAATPAIDPVCGMEVAPVPASLSLEHGGGTVWFCGPGCRDAFRAEPARYAR